MKLLITESQCKFLMEEYYENYSSDEDYFQLYDEAVREVFESIKNKQKIKMRKINPSQYQTALSDFMRFPRNPHFVRFPVKYIYRWKSLMIENVVMLDVLTSIHGHSEHFPYDEFYDTFNYTESYQSDQLNLFTAWCKQRYQETGDKGYLRDYNWSSVYEYLDEVCDIDSYVPFFSNGQPVLSDFGLRPLQKLVSNLLDVDDANEIIIIINKMLDIVHARSDLAELFIIGGSASLDSVAGYERQPEYHGP